MDPLAFTRPANVGALLVCALVAAAAQAQQLEQRDNVEYGRVGDERLLLDLTLPKADGPPRPAVLLVHGGGWRGGSREGDQGLAQFLAQRGYVVAAVDYRLAPKWHYPAQLDDVQRAVRWVRKHADELNIDPTRLGASGGSAGGHLVSLLGTRETREEVDPALTGLSSKVQCVIDLFGPADLNLATYLEELPDPALRPMLTEILNDFLGKAYDQDPALWRDASPIAWVARDNAPFAIIHGTADTLVGVNQSKRFAAALQQAGVEVDLDIVEGLGHGPQAPEQHKPFEQALLRAVTFLDRHLKPAGAVAK